MQNWLLKHFEWTVHWKYQLDIQPATSPPAPAPSSPSSRAINTDSPFQGSSSYSKTKTKEWFWIERIPRISTTVILPVSLAQTIIGSLLISQRPIALSDNIISPCFSRQSTGPIYQIYDVIYHMKRYTALVLLLRQVGTNFQCSHKLGKELFLHVNIMLLFSWRNEP